MTAASTEDRILDVAEFIDRHGRYPRFSAGRPEREKQLARFLGRARLASAGGGNLVLSRREISLLDLLVPEWRKPLRLVSRDESIRDLSESLAEAPERREQIIRDARWLRAVALGESTLTEEQQLAVDEIAPGWRDVFRSRFDQSLHRAALAAEKRDGAVPALRDSDVDARRSAKWLSEQRGAARGTRARRTKPMPQELISKLDEAVPRWQEPTDRAPVRDDAKFRQRAEEVAAFRSQHGRLPRPGVREENSLAVWLVHVRRAAHGKGCLAWDETRCAIMDEALPGWRPQPRRIETFETNVELLAAFITRHGRHPRASGTAPDEARLSQWLNRAREARRGGGNLRWNAEREALVQRALPGVF